MRISYNTVLPTAWWLCLKIIRKRWWLTTEGSLAVNDRSSRRKGAFFTWKWTTKLIFGVKCGKCASNALKLTLNTVHTTYVWIVAIFKVYVCIPLNVLFTTASIRIFLSVTFNCPGFAIWKPWNLKVGLIINAFRTDNRSKIVRVVCCVKIS